VAAEEVIAVDEEAAAAREGPLDRETGHAPTMIAVTIISPGETNATAVIPPNPRVSAAMTVVPVDVEAVVTVDVVVETEEGSEAVVDVVAIAVVSVAAEGAGAIVVVPTDGDATIVETDGTDHIKQNNQGG